MPDCPAPLLRPRTAALVCLLLGLWAGLASAQGAPEAPGSGEAPAAAPPAPTAAQAAPTTCPPGNVLAGRKPAQSSGVVNPGRITDGVAPEEGDEWRTDLTATLGSTSAQVTYDLGARVTLRALLLQGDNNDHYEVSTSVDGQNYTSLWTAPHHINPGMRVRVESGLEREARFLRIGNAKGDGSYSLGEVMAYCETPATWPPNLSRKKGKAPQSTAASRERRMSDGKMMLALLGALAFLGLFLFSRKRDPILLLLAPVGGGGALLYALWMTRNEVLMVDPSGESRPWHVRGLLIASVALGLLAVALVVRLARGQRVARLAERSTYIALILASGLTWVNFATFHGSRVIHYWDSFHYYMGSKYFKELGYTLLYHCAGVGEIDDGLRAEFAKRQIRDLRDNKLGPALPALDDPRECRKNFTTERWAAFRQDLRLFRSFMGSAWWAKMFKDHGYNATPVWNLVGATFTNLGWREDVPAVGQTTAPVDLNQLPPDQRQRLRKLFDEEQRPAFERHLGRLVALDFLLYIGLFGLIAWAFGLRACALAMVVWGAGYPWAYFWTGGAYGRVPWLFMAVAGMCLLKRGMPLLGGLGLTWSALLRGFPAGFVVGVTLQIAWRFVATLLGRTRPGLAEEGVPAHDRATRPSLLARLPIGRAHWRFIAGCTLAVGILIPASVPVAGSAQAWPDFLANTAKHKDTPLTNHMGLPTLLSYHPARVSRHTKNDKLDDPFSVWKAERQRTLKERKWLHYGLLALFALLVGYVGRRLADWEVTALSGLFVIGVFELTCYYYNFVVMLAPLALRRWRYVFALIGMSLTTQILHQKVGWYDEQYTYETVAVLAAYLFILGDLVWRVWRGGPDSVPRGGYDAEALEVELLAAPPVPAVPAAAQAAG